MRRALVALALVLVACGGGDADMNVQARVASNQLGIGLGEQRVLIALIDLNTQAFVASPDVAVTATLRSDVGSPLGEYSGEFVWIVPGVRGLYSFRFDFPAAGTYQVTVDAGDLGVTGPVGVIASEDPRVVMPGEAAPLSVTRTIPEYELADITSDPNPEPSFYEMTVADAISSGPSVIVFGTPAWCTSQACGPMLDQVKALAAEFPGLHFVHVEVYDNIHVETFEELEFVPAVQEWGLVAEPVIFVTDASGVVSAAFEGAASDNELRAAFQAVSG